MEGVPGGDMKVKARQGKARLGERYEYVMYVPTPASAWYDKCCRVSRRLAPCS